MGTHASPFLGPNRFRGNEVAHASSLRLDESGFRKLEAYATEGGMPNQPNDLVRGASPLTCPLLLSRSAHSTTTN
jgi:hypothetical protein